MCCEKVQDFGFQRHGAMLRETTDSRMVVAYDTPHAQTCRTLGTHSTDVTRDRPASSRKRISSHRRNRHRGSPDLRAAFIVRKTRKRPTASHPLSKSLQAPWRAPPSLGAESRQAPCRARVLRTHASHGISGILAPMTAQRSPAARSHASLILELSAGASVRRGARICSEIACMP